MKLIKPIIYLVKEGITDPSRVLNSEKRFAKKVGDGATLFYIKNEPEPAEWAEFIATNFDVQASDFSTLRSNAVVVISESNRLFAIPYGTGFQLINTGAIVMDFGLRTALNCIPKDNIRQLDTATPEAKPYRTKTQAAIDSDTDGFRVNKHKDILKGIVGRLSPNHPLGTSLEGKDSLRLSEGVFNIKGLAEMCRRALDYYSKKIYQDHFDWIDNISLVRDRATIDLLRTSLVDALNSSEFEQMHFSPPVFYDDTFMSGGFVFSFGDGVRLKNKTPLEFPSMSDWRDALPLGKTITLATLDSMLVHLWDGEGSAKNWPISYCIAWETELGKDKYVLSEGSWYQVKSSFVADIDQYYQQRIMTGHSIPSPSTFPIKESDYNKELSVANQGWYLFDLGHPSSKRLSIAKGNEVCDLYDSHNRSFYHVKKGKRSTDLSHLFRQGAFSGIALHRDETALKEFRKHLKTYKCKIGVNGKFDARSHNIIFLLLLAKNQKQDIPFFSKLSFYDVDFHSLANIGYKSRIAFVQAQ